LCYKRGLLSAPPIIFQLGIISASPPKAGSRLGHTHSDETRQKISDTQKGNINGFKKGQSRPVGSGMPSQQIEVFDNKTNQTTTYDSIHKAARA
jgi:hypothetical protein